MPVRTKAQLRADLEEAREELRECQANARAEVEESKESERRLRDELAELWQQLLESQR